MNNDKEISRIFTHVFSIIPGVEINFPQPPAFGKYL